MLHFKDLNSHLEVGIAEGHVESVSATEKMKDGKPVTLVRMSSGAKHLVVGDYLTIFKDVQKGQSKVRRL